MLAEPETARQRSFVRFLPFATGCCSGRAGATPVIHRGGRSATMKSLPLLRAGPPCCHRMPFRRERRGPAPLASLRYRFFHLEQSRSRAEALNPQHRAERPKIAVRDHLGHREEVTMPTHRAAAAQQRPRHPDTARPEIFRQHRDFTTAANAIAIECDRRAVACHMTAIRARACPVSRHGETASSAIMTRLIHLSWRAV